MIGPIAADLGHRKSVRASGTTAAILLIIIVACGDQDNSANDSEQATHSGDSATSASPNLPAYHSLPDETFDVPLATRVIRRVVLDEPATRNQIEAVVRAEFADARLRVGFKHHHNPTAVGVYVFSTETQARADEGLWLAMLYTSDTSTSDPAVDVNDVRLATAWAIPEERFGLSEEKRMEIYRAIVGADDRAASEARRLHGSDPASEVESARELREAYRGEVAREYGLSIEHLYEIIAESLEKGWPSS